uniref:cytosolic beta-glucosidase-like n=1 Tax=Styela clava TaxID=7725 RepID=UPI00193A49FD|nr:cytosolic beta-glucosidase-like [Styela clava]
MAKSGIISGKFSKDFAWGVSTSAYQIEGAWEDDGKGKSIWDDFTHTSGHVEDSKNGDVACDSYNKVEEDVKMLKDLGVSHYRFSFSWPRIMPSGKRTEINKAGVDYYNKLIDLLIKNNIQPMATLYHWDLPSALEDIGGWLNEEISDLFADYADYCFEQFGDRVKLWVTINEPQIVAYLGYCVGLHAPGVKDTLNKPYLVSRVLLLSHAKAYRVYDKKYRAKQGGKLSIAINSDWGEPANGGKDQKDVDAANLHMQFTNCWFADPVFLSGDYPPLMKKALEKKWKEEGCDTCRLPTFTDEEKKLLKGSFDYFALNYYTTRIINPATEESENRFHPDLEVEAKTDPTWERAGSQWLYIVPWGLRKLLNFIKNRYNSPTIMITENGCSTKHAPEAPLDETLQKDDTQRAEYIKSHVQEVLKAYKEDGVDIQGYYVWSLMDNFEWSAGYTERFGLYHVDFESGKRTPRKSAEVYKSIVANNGF